MSMDRRWWLYGAGALAAGAAGLFSQLRQPVAGPAAPNTAPKLPAEPTLATFWQSSFPTPDGGSLAMQPLLGQWLVLNFWATWCPPCIKEMPELDRLARDHAAHGVRLVGLAIDAPTPVRQFLQRTPVSYPIALAGLEGTELARALGNTQGGLPFTAVFDRSGQVLHRKLGETSYAELAGWLAPARQPR